MIITKRLLLSGAGALALVFAVSLPTLAQDKFPSRAVNMIVPFPPGGVADQTGRPVAAGMEKALKQPVIVANKQGAGGAVGMAAVANAKSDGYTILMALSSISIIPEADKLFDRKPAYQMNRRHRRAIAEGFHGRRREGKRAENAQRVPGFFPAQRAQARPAAANRDQNPESGEDRGERDRQHPRARHAE